jgi:hypothetical protein
MSELTTTARLARAARGRSLDSRVKPWVTHARKFGDPRSVFETAAQELSARELGYLAARLRSTKPIKENDHYIVNRDTRNERHIPWPRFQLTAQERERLAARMLAEGVGPKTIATYLGSTVTWVKRFAEELEGRERASELLAEHGPVDLLDSSTPTELGRAWTAILGGTGREAKLPKSGLPTSTDKGNARPIPALGGRFGRLEIRSLWRDGRGRLIALVRCDCGTEKTVRAGHLGKTKSCGCLRRERMAAMRRGQG